MFLRQSAVSSVTRDTIFEEASRLPDDIYPALIGSGEIGLGLDATGLQGMNCRTRQYRDTMSLVYGTPVVQDDLSIRRDSALSKHDLACDPLWNPETNFLNLPSGWLDYTLDIDGESYDTVRLVAEGTQWRRQFSPLTGIVETSFRLGQVELTWQVGVAPGAVEIDFSFDAASLDGRSRAIALTVRCHQTARSGLALATGGMETTVADGMIFRAWDASNETSTAPVFEPIRVTWGLACYDDAQYTAEETCIAVRREARGERMTSAFRLVTGSDRNGTETQEYAVQRMRVFRAGSPLAALNAIAAAWQEYFAGGADVHVGDPYKEYLVLQAQYLMRGGCGWHHGIPMSTLWTQAITPANYWDSFFTADGMLRAGHVDLVRSLCQWLMGSVLPTGRPHYWMTYYNGVPVEANDEAYQVILAYSGIMMRLYSCTRDRKDLEGFAYPYLRRVAAFAFDEVLTKSDAGWHLYGQVAHDVDTGANVAKEQAGMLLWVVVCIAKCAEYATELGIDDDLMAKCREVDAYFRANPIDLSNPGMWSSWLPYLTAAEPLADYASWGRFMRGQLEATTGKFLGNPWGNFTVATSLSMVGQPDLALEMQDDGFNSISGLGYIDEVTYENHGGGWAPFPTSTGPWLASMMIQFAHGTLWDDEVGICTNLSKRYAAQYLRWRNVLTLNGVRVSGAYDPHHLEVTVETARPRRVRLRIPYRIAGEMLHVQCNGKPVNFTEVGETVLLDVPAGEHAITIARDLTTPAEVIIAEPFNCGREMAQIIAASGTSVRWLRDYDALKLLASSARVVILHASNCPIPLDVALALETAVREHGLTVVTLYHAGCSNVDRALAELAGTRALFDGTERQYWLLASSERTYRLTDAGKAIFATLPESFVMPTIAKFIPRLADDVEVLATDDETGRAVVTRRPVGAGQVFWIATGGKLMDFGDINKIHRAMKRQWLFGEDPQDQADLKWLQNADFQQMLLALATDSVTARS